MLILDPWGISVHAVIVFGLGKNLLFKSVLGRCGPLLRTNDRGSKNFSEADNRKFFDFPMIN